MNNNKKKTAKEKRVLIGALCVAAVMIAGSTFAWFSSKDEVTNRLSANASYGTEIVEDFTAPENMLPGQTVNKDVSVVNTGNIDALVRVHLEGAMNVLKEKAVADEVNYDALPAVTNVTDENLIALGLTKKDANDNFYRTLSTTERPNPKLGGDTEDTNSDGAAVESSEDNTYSEVEAVQAGGYLVYAGGNFEFTPESAGYTYVDTSNKTQTQPSPTKLTNSDIKNTWNGGVGLEIDSDTFKPTSAGLFIFRRNVEEDGTNGTYYEYSGYYFDGTNYYALHYLPNEGGTTYHSDYVIYSTKTPETGGNVLAVTYEATGDIKTPVVSVVPTTVKLFSAAYTRTTGMVGTYNATDGTVTFTNNSTGTPADTDIVVTANVSNINNTPDSAATAETWTALTETGSHTYFYYNNDVEEGDSTAKLVDSVKLADATKKSAYLALDFDLNVLLDSIQVTAAEDGTELMPGGSKADNKATPWTGGAQGTATNTDSEITKIAWAASTV